MHKVLSSALTALPLAALGSAPKTLTLNVQNMTYQLCPVAVKKSREKIPGVSIVKLNFEKKMAIVNHDADQAMLEALTKVTANACYPSSVRK